MTFTVTFPIECETQEQAAQIARERLGHWESRGFHYELGRASIQVAS